MDKTTLSESDICDRYITPAIVAAGWDMTTQMRREFGFTAGRVIVRGKFAVRGQRKRADYLLFYQPNLPIAVVEAKDNHYPVGGGMQQALAYAEALDVPFVFSSNGDAFVFHDRTGLTTRSRTPSPSRSFRRRTSSGAATGPGRGSRTMPRSWSRVPYHDDGSGKQPRYYQRIAIQRTIEAIAHGQRRVLLAMATGTGKTYTAFQIIWRLWKAGTVKRVLFLADRNILIDQTITNDFKPFGSVMTKVRNRTVDKSYEVYLALYQAVSGTEEEKNVYKQFSPDFFDLVVDRRVPSWQRP